jgi:hypothetical protein
MFKTRNLILQLYIYLYKEKEQIKHCWREDILATKKIDKLMKKQTMEKISRARSQFFKT